MTTRIRTDPQIEGLGLVVHFADCILIFCQDANSAPLHDLITDTKTQRRHA